MPEARLPESIGSYIIKKKIGQGGMGTVFEAVHETLERPSALKLLPPEFSSNPEYVSRFLREARVLAGLRHENVVQVYDAGTEDGRYFIAMELMEGISFGEYLEEHSAIDDKIGLEFLLQSAKGLEAAHAKELVHRDIKPENLLLDKDHKTIRIVDFGLVMESASTTQLTATGACLGTPQFMSPEQADGEKADARSDIYSLGVTFYKAFSGQIPFNSPTVMNLLFKHKFEAPPDLRSFKPNLPKNVCNLILTMMAKRREDRPQNATDLIALIERVKQGKKIPAAPVFDSPVNSDGSIVTSAPRTDGSTAIDLIQRFKWPLLGGVGVGLLVLILLGRMLFGSATDDDKPVAVVDDNKKSGENTSGGNEDPDSTRPPSEIEPEVKAVNRDPKVEAFQALLVEAKKAQADRNFPEALKRLQAAQVLGAPNLDSQIKNAHFMIHIGHAVEKEKQGDLAGALTAAKEAKKFGDAKNLIERLQQKLIIAVTKSKADGLAAKGDFEGAAEQYAAAAEFIEDPQTKAVYQRYADENRRKGYLAKGRAAELAKNWVSALAAYSQAQKIQNDPLLDAKLTELKRKAAEDPAYQINLAAGDKAIADGKILLADGRWLAADQKFIQAQALYLKAYEAKESSKLPGLKMKEAEAHRAICRGDVACADGEWEKAKVAYAAAPGLSAALAKESEQRLAKLKKKTDTLTRIKSVKSPAALEAEVLQMVKAGRGKAAMARLATELSRNAGNEKAAQLKAALENLQACEVVYQDLQNILDSSLTAARDASEVDSLGTYIRTFKVGVKEYKEEAEEGLALDRAKFNNKNYSGLDLSVRNAKSLARSSAAKFQSAHDLYKAKGDKLTEGTRVKVPFLGWKIKEPTARDTAKGAKLRRIARSFQALERKARNLSR